MPVMNSIMPSVDTGACNRYVINRYVITVSKREVAFTGIYKFFLVSTANRERESDFSSTK